MESIRQRISAIERSKLVAKEKGWGPLTQEEKNEIEEIVKMVTNIN